MPESTLPPQAMLEAATLPYHSIGDLHTYSPLTARLQRFGMSITAFPWEGASNSSHRDLRSLEQAQSYREALTMAHITVALHHAPMSGVCCTF